MKHKFKVGDKVRILWHKSPYSYGSDYMNTGEVRKYFNAPDGIPIVELFNFHKREKYWGLYFPVYAVRPLGEVFEDGDAL